jgi:hypothetical protein
MGPGDFLRQKKAAGPGDFLKGRKPVPRDGQPQRSGAVDSVVGPIADHFSLRFPTKGETLGGSGHGKFNDLITMGLGKHAAAAGANVPREIMSWFTGKDFDYTKAHGEHVENYKQERDKWAAENPIANAAVTTAGVVGSIPATGVIKPAATIMGRSGQAATLSGIQGGVQSGAEQSRMKDVLPAASMGAATGAVVGGALSPVTDIAGYGLGKVMGRAQPAKGVDAGARMQLADQFDIPLTQGQVTGNIPQQAKELTITRTGTGPGQRTMQGFFDSQEAAIRGKGDEIGDYLGRGVGVSDDLAAGSAVQKGLTDVAGVYKQRGQELYQAADDMSGQISRTAIENYPDLIVSKIKASNFKLDPKLHPSVFSWFEDLDALANKGVLHGPPVLPSTKPVSFDEFWKLGKRLNGLKAKNDADDAAIQMVQKAWRESWDAAADTSFFAGAKEAMDMVKDGNYSYSKYLDLTRPEPGDKVGQRIAEIIKDNPTGNQVVNWLIGKSASGSAGYGPQMVAKLKEVLGEGSAEVMALRQTMWSHLTDGGAQKISSNIDQFLDGSGAALAKELFDAKELKLIRDFGKAVKLTVPLKEATNYSNSGYQATRGMKNLMHGIWSMVGLAAGGLDSGLTGGLVGGIAGGLGSSGFRTAADAIAANRAITPDLSKPWMQAALQALVPRAASVPATEKTRNLAGYD